MRRLPITAQIIEGHRWAELSMSQHTDCYELVRLAFKERQVDGTEPFVQEFQVPGRLEPEELLPAGSVISRSATTEKSRAVLARCSNATVLLLLHRHQSLVAVSTESAAESERLADEIRSRVPDRTPPDTVPLRTWYVNGDRVDSHKRDIAAPRWVEVDRNYPTAVRQDLEALTQLRTRANTGKLILWHGPPGTGKTTALRALMRAWAPWCDAHYIADPERFFGLPGYIAEVIGEGRSGNDNAASRWQLVIAEDCDEYLRASARQDAGAALGRLLNLADGVLGQGYNTLILLTTNEDLRTLHPAITRPGRCLAQLEFTEFSYDEARSWLPAKTALPDRAFTLAELYEQLGELTSIRQPAEAVTVGQYL